MLQKTIALLLSSSLGLAACTLPGPTNNPAMANINSVQQARAAVQQGMTMDQVRAKLGAPSSSQSFNGQTTWAYTAGSGTIDPMTAIGLGNVRIQSRAVVVTFNSSGRVTRVDYNETMS